MDMVKLEKYQGFAADMAGAGLSSALLADRHPRLHHTYENHGHPWAWARPRRLSSVNWGVVREMVLTWVLTFPGCGLIGYLCARLFCLYSEQLQNIISFH